MFPVLALCVYEKLTQCAPSPVSVVMKKTQFLITTRNNKRSTNKQKIREREGENDCGRAEHKEVSIYQYN